MTIEEAKTILDEYGLHLRRRKNLFSVKIKTFHGRSHLIACETVKETVVDVLKLLKVLGIQKRI